MLMLLSPRSPSTFFLLDVTITLTLFGHFDSQNFSIAKVLEQLNAVPSYSISSSPLDFLLISVIRLALFAASFYLHSIEKSSVVTRLNKPISAFCVASVSFALLKYLLFSEQERLLDYAGTWLLPAWTVLSSALFYALWVVEFENCFEKSDGGVQEDDEVAITKKEQILILLRYSIENWPWLLLGTTLTTATAAVQVAIPHYKSEVMNGITAIQDSVDIFFSAKILAALTVISMVLTGARNSCFSRVNARTVCRMRKDLFSAVISQEIGFFDKHKSGEIVSRLTSDVNSLAGRLETNCNYSFRTILTLIGKLVFMISISWQLTLINFIAFPMIIFTAKFCGEFCDLLGDMTGEATADAHSTADEIVSTIRTVRSFAAEGIVTKKFEDVMSKEEEIAKKESIAMMGFHISSELYHNFIYVVVLMYGAHLSTTGRIDSASLVSFMMYQIQIGDHIEALAWAFPEFMGTLGKSRKFCQFLKRKPRIRTDGEVTTEVKGEFNIDNVSFKYPSRPTNQVLNTLSLHIRAGETLALVGPSGGGKSTIVAMLERFYDPDEGEIQLDGVPLRDYDHEYFHRKIALVAQEPVLYDCSVRENIAFGFEATEEDIIAAAKMANAHEFVMGLDRGYETSCGEKGTQMSGGQKQRIAIARALVRNPSVLILDEATSALDNYSEQIVQEAMQRCAANRTVIVIAHRLSTIEKADRIAVIDKGSVVQLGSHSALLHDESGLYHTLVYSKQQEMSMQKQQLMQKKEEIVIN